MHKQEGITLVVLVITVVLMLILAGAGLQAGMASLESYQVKQFAQELEIVQAKTNVIYQKIKAQQIEPSTLGQNIQQLDEQTKAKIVTALKGKPEEDFRYFDEKDLKDIEIDSIKRSFIINFSTRQVISVEGLKANGTIYYSLEDFPNSFYLVQAQKEPTQEPTFQVDVEIYGLTAKVKVKDIHLAQENTKATIFYREKGKSYDNQVQENEIELKKSGTYEIKVVDASRK